MEAIVAVYSDWGIGRDGTQPVVIRADRRHFAEVTGGSAVIVGRKTLEDFPGGRPLKNRVNLVLTHRNLEIPDAVVVHSAEEAAEAAALFERAFVIGGESVYRQMLPYVQRVYVTKIDCALVSTAFFPNLDEDPAWEITDAGEPLEQDGIIYRFMVYERKEKTSE